MKTLNKVINEQLKDPEFKREYEKLQPEMDVIRAMVDARILLKSSSQTEQELIRQI